MHALGNNYIYISEWEESLKDIELPDLVRQVSDVRKGIGSDGLILVSPSEVAEVRMRIFNADGSEAETCGNGLRCVAKYVYDRGYVTTSEFKIETLAGVVGVQVFPMEDGDVHRVTVDMGPAVFGPEAVGYLGPMPIGRVETALPLPGQTSLQGTMVSMGNPHFVVFVPDAKDFPVADFGPQEENHSYFPQRINVEFVSPRNREELDFRVWERGSGITFACGTGACASVAVGVAKGLLEDKVVVHLLGGDLEIEVREGRIWMSGEAVEIFRGEYHFAGH
jgi:diaminopimelate epimerase